MEQVQRDMSNLTTCDEGELIECGLSYIFSTNIKFPGEHKKPKVFKRQPRDVVPAELKKEVTGLTHECGVFGAIACGDWPTQVSFLSFYVETYTHRLVSVIRSVPLHFISSR